MNLIPANQTLILAGESALPGRALTSGAVLRRVIVVQADYAPSADAAAAPAPAPNLLPYDTESRSIAGPPARISLRASTLSPAEQYARVQRGDTAAAALIDVHA